MVRFIKCPSCNSVNVSIHADEYRKLADEKIRKEIKNNYPDVLPKNYPKISGIDIETDDIFEKLGVKNICCRIHIANNYDNISETEK